MATPAAPAAPEVKTALNDTDTSGKFKRMDAQFRQWVRADGSTPFTPEADRYHLYISYACPWASRCIAVREIKGLVDVIGLSVVRAKWNTVVASTDAKGWVFNNGDANDEDDATTDTVNGCKTVRDLYLLADPAYGGRFTVPVLWDKKNKTIVSNESSEIIRMFNAEFNAVAKRPEIDLYPAELRGEIDAVNAWVYDSINNGVYKCGFATTQAAYDEAIEELYAGLARAESILSKKRFLAGNRLTEADIRLFVTLIRFDEVYVVHFKCNRATVREYPALFGYIHDIYQTNGIATTVNMTHIKNHYYGSHPQLNPRGIVAAGPNIDHTKPHTRATLP
eukprot:Opistho-2@78353